MKNKKRITIALFILLAAVIYYSLSKSNKKTIERTLIVGVRTDIADWAFYNADSGRCIGIEADIATLLAEKAGFSDIRYVAVDKHNGEEKLLNGEVNCLIYTNPPEDSSSDTLLYSQIYYQMTSATIAKKSTLFTSFEDLSGKPVGILADETISGTFLTEIMEEENLEPPIFVIEDDILSLTDALETGSVSAICVPTDIAYTLEVGDCEYIGGYLFGAKDVAAAVLKTDPDGQAIIEGMNALINNNSIYDLLKEWRWI